MGIKEALEILGLTNQATREDIHTSFRKLAIKHHPDLYQTFSGKARATRKFIEIKETYDLLMASRSSYEGNMGLQGDHFEEVDFINDSIESKARQRAMDILEYDSHNPLSKILDKFFNYDTTIGKIGGILISPFIFGFFPYFIMISILNGILKIFKIPTGPGRFSHLINNSIAPLIYLPFFIGIGLMFSGRSSPSAFVVITSIILYTGVLLFVISEWICYFKVRRMSRSIRSDLKRISMG